MDKKIQFFSFALEKAKDYFYNTNEKYVKWGADDKTPNKYLELLNSVPEHESAINFTASLLQGDGIEEMNYFQFCRVVLDYYIFGGFSVQVIRTKGGQFRIEYLERDRIRVNQERTKACYITVKEFGKKELSWLPITNNIMQEGIFIYDNFKTRGQYPQPYYLSALQSLENMAGIIDYHGNNIQNGFSPTIIISVPNSNMDATEQQEMMEGLNENYLGAKGNKVICLFGNTDGNETKITRLESDNMDEKFETLQKFIQSQIVVAHKLTSPHLIGIPSDNNGFTKVEFDEALTVFKEIIISSYKKELEYALGLLFNKEIVIKETEDKKENNNTEKTETNE